MRFVVLFLGALLLGAPVFSQAPHAADPKMDRGRFEWFSMTETKEQVDGSLGHPVLVADFGADFQTWQYQLVETADHDAFSHQLVFRKSERALVSIARNYDPEVPVDAFFPPSETTVYAYPNTRAPQFNLRFRRLTGGRALLAMGKMGQATSQVVLIRESELRFFYPWLAEQLHGEGRGTSSHTSETDSPLE